MASCDRLPDRRERGLTDRTENAVKFVGDPYAVRLFRLAADA